MQISSVQSVALFEFGALVARLRSLQVSCQEEGADKFLGPFQLEVSLELDRYLAVIDESISFLQAMAIKGAA